MAAAGSPMPPGAGTSRWLLAVGAPAFLATALLAVRLVWEQTVWTWERGPQMVGFVLVHGPFAFLLLAPVALAAWVLLAAILSAWRWWKTRRIPWTVVLGLGAAVGLLVTLSLPEGFWQRLFIARTADAPRAGEILAAAAGRGDLALVDGLVSRGVPVDFVDRHYRRTALHAAAVHGRVPVLRYLVARGLDVNAVDRYGDSPLELAASRGHDAAARFLAEHGAVRLRGDEARREQASRDQVREEIEETRAGPGR
jgi:hypothetical protein